MQKPSQKAFDSEKIKFSTNQVQRKMVNLSIYLKHKCFTTLSSQRLTGNGIVFLCPSTYRYLFHSLAHEIVSEQKAFSPQMQQTIVDMAFTPKR
jgi:hypothetical protein